MDPYSKIIHFLSGMPRAGTTVLGNILAQNPRIHVTPTSGLPQLFLEMRETCERSMEYRAAPDDNELMGILRGIMFGSFAWLDRPVIISRSRAWPDELELLESILRRKAKVIVCVRDIPEILASMEKIWRDNKAVRGINASASRGGTLEGRCNTWLSRDHLVGHAYAAIQDALVRGYRDRLHFVHFDDLTSHPKEVMERMYKFLGEEPFSHNFDHVEQVTVEDDAVHGFKGLHSIRSAVRPVPKRAKDLLGPLAEKFKGPYVWDQYVSRVRPPA
jgi:sulfotransferase